VTVSALLAVQLAGFMLQYLIAFIQDIAVDPAIGVASILTTNALLAGTALLLLRRWQTPLGTFAVLYAGVALMLNGIISFAGWPTVIPAPVVPAGGRGVVAGDVGGLRGRRGDHLGPRLVGPAVGRRDRAGRRQ
jgi:hypothetical protein